MDNPDHARPGTGASAYRKAETGSDVTRRNVKAMRELEEAAMARRTGADRAASAIARFCGSMTFVWIHVLVFATWIGYNSLPWFDAFDPYPFTFLTLVVSLEAIFLSTFILISQNYALGEATRPHTLVEQIEEAYREDEAGGPAGAKKPR